MLLYTAGADFPNTCLYAVGPQRHFKLAVRLDTSQGRGYRFRAHCRHHIHTAMLAGA